MTLRIDGNFGQYILTEPKKDRIFRVKQDSLFRCSLLDWATEIAKREDVAIVSGFHSRTEREVLEFLLNGKCGIICVLARSIYKRCPEIYRKAFDANRVLFISPINTTSYRSSRDTCQQRNEYIASISDQLVFSSLTTESSLYPIAAFHPDSIKL